jgi:hypothetical protein
MKALLFIALLAQSLTVSALENECGELAEIDGTTYAISASGGDDTATIQCALDSATRQGIGTVKLARGEFNVTSLKTVGFNGTFQGTSKADTVLIIDNGFASCGEVSADAAPMFEFAGGNVAVKFMTIDVDRPCDRYSTYATLVFTQESCAKRTFFGVVDRVVLKGTFNTTNSGIAVAVRGIPECVEDGKGPLGTFKLNRSEIDTYDLGVYTSLLGAAQVDVNFNDFKNVFEGVGIIDASQNTTITNNSFSYYGYAVYALALTDIAPAKNRTVVHANVFNQLQDARFNALAVFVGNISVRAEHSVVVTSNVINSINDGSQGKEQYGVFLNDTDGALVANNEFTGSNTATVYVSSANFNDNTTSTSITGNSFGSAIPASGCDIYLNSSTTSSVVGPDQQAFLCDFGRDNLVSREQF